MTSPTYFSLPDDDKLILIKLSVFEILSLLNILLNYDIVQ